MKKLFEKLYIGIFVLICFSLFLLMPLSHSDMSVEKREAASLPSIKSQDGSLNTGFFEDLTEYFSDNFAFRQQLATVDAVIKSKVFGTSNNEKAIVGKNTWLYFNGSLDDYFGRNLLNDREIYAAAKTIELMQEYSENHNCRFAFAIAPNKNTLYPENMPSNYLAAEGDTNIERLSAKLDYVNYIDLQSTFLSQDKIMYHKWDSHWNNEGATLACDKILTGVDKEHYDYSNEPSRVEAVHSGDVWQLIYPSWDCKDDNVIYEKEHTYSYVNPVESVEDMYIMTSCPEKEGTVVVFRDSFGNALLPYVADEYGSGVFIKGMPLNVKQIENSQADTLIFELVERNIPNIIAYLPVMDAPERSIEGTLYKLEDSKTTIQYEDKTAQYVIYGELDPGYVDVDTNIFIRIKTDSGKEKVYEATPAAYEKPADGADMSYYYGAYINKTDIGEDFTAEVICQKKNDFYSTKTLDIVYN